MHHLLAVGVTALASLSATSAVGVTFSGFPASGSYEDVASLNPDGTCTFVTKAYSGTPAPLTEELSAIIRGPLTLKKFAVYNLDTAAAKRSEHAKRHAHQAFHEHNKEVREAKEEKRANGDVIVATYPGGGLMTMTENWDSAASTPAPVPDSKVAVGASPVDTPPVKAGAGNWGQVASYDSATGHASGLAFQANNNWKNYKGLGAVVGYVGTDGKSVASASTVLADTQLPDNTEIIISSDVACTATSCGTVAPGSNAHHGFAGENKMFVFEFGMPKTGNKGFNGDMPAIWLLNSKIPNTQQYSKCSPWATGAGEWDLHEILTSGADIGYTSFHMGDNYAGTPPEGFARPSTGTMKLAAVVSNGAAYVAQLPDDATFDAVLPGSTVAHWTSLATSQFKVIPHPLHV